MNDGDYLKTLRISKEYSAKRKSLKNCLALSVFGYTAMESIFEAESAFVSWKHWKKASKIYFDCLPQTLPRSDGIDLSANPGEKGQVTENINGQCKFPTEICMHCTYFNSKRSVVQLIHFLLNTHEFLSAPPLLHVSLILFSLPTCSKNMGYY